MAIVSWRHKGLKKFFEEGTTKGIQSAHENRLAKILFLLDAANHVDDMDLPGFKLHLLNPKKDKIYSVSVSGNWRVTFKITDGNAELVDYLDYH